MAVVLVAVLFAQAAWARPPVGWRMDGSGNYPFAEPPLEWSPTHNVLWATSMPSWSNSSPILVGDRLFLTSEPDSLVCVSAVDGKILWRRANPIEDAAPTPIEHKPFLQMASQQRQAQISLQEREYELTRVRRRLRTSPSDLVLVDEAQALATQADDLRREAASLARFMKPNVNPEAGYSSPTPTSDGESVYVLFATGIAASYDLEGRRRWMKYLDQPPDRDGLSSSPVLVGGTLLLFVNDLLALDKATGDVLWRAQVPARQGTPAPFRIGDQDLVIVPSGHCVRVADGAILASELGDLEYASPLIHDGVLYMIQETSQAYRIPGKPAEALEFERLWKTQIKGLRYYSSPLLVDGLLYAILRNQLLTVLDAGTGVEVFTHKLSLGQTGGANSVYASPTQGGRHVFVSGFGGTIVILAPGRQYQQLGSNDLEKFRASPIFDGDRMYVRGYDKLYCISASAERSRNPDLAAP